MNMRRIIVIAVIFFITMGYPILCGYSVWKELSVAHSVWTSDEYRGAPHTTVVRVVGERQLEFLFNPDTCFFLYKDCQGIIRMGYYWKNLPILEKKFHIPFVGSNFNEIPPILYIEDSPLHKTALDRLEKLKKIPLSFIDKLSLMIETTKFKLFTGVSH